jgi:hypothetical protein
LLTVVTLMTCSETPNKKHHKFIEFYDVRDAEKAMKHLNKTEIKVRSLSLCLSCTLLVGASVLMIIVGTDLPTTVEEDQNRTVSPRWRS